MTAPYAHIAVCVDDSDASARAVGEGLRLRGLGPGRLTLLHVAPAPLLMRRTPEGWEPDPADIHEAERRWLEDLAARTPGAEPALETGHPPDAAIEWARRARPDLLVAAAHRGPLERVLLGSFAARLAHEAPCTVLLVRPGPAPPG